MTREKFNQIVKKISSFASEFTYKIDVDGWTVLLTSMWASSRTSYIKIDFCNSGIICYYTLNFEDNGNQYPEYLTLNEMQELMQIIYE